MKSLGKHISSRNVGFGLGLAALFALAGCQTAGNESLLSRALPGSQTQQQDQLASNDPNRPIQPGTNPNAGTRLKNTQNALSDYCPAVRIRAGTESFRDVPKGADRQDIDNVRFQATITKVARECAYVGENLEIKVGARGRVITGPSGKPGTTTMPIRVAVTRGTETVYSKLHRPQSTIPDGASNANFSFVDDRVIIPAPTATNVRVYIGFDEGPYDTP